MRDLWCPACRGRVFFADATCLRCGAELAFDPATDHVVVAGSVPSCLERFGPEACSWVAADGGRCRSCALDLEPPGPASPAVARAPFQLARRRTVRQLLQRGLDPDGARPPLRFRLLQGGPDAPVTIGHADGVVTLDLAEADPAARERTRISLGEPYRTPLGHVRHEVGHWVWAVRVDGGPALDRFRQLFGDERQPYAQALERHYAAPDDGSWRSGHLSHYAAAHPWEDFAESVAHLLHLDDTLETAHSHGLAAPPAPGFDERYASWLALSVALNDLNRSMGTADPYPFSPPPAAVDKIRFVDDLVPRLGGAAAASAR